MIKIICVGKIKETYFREAIDEYKKRLSKYTDIEIIEIPDEGLTDIKTTLKKESEKISKQINQKDYIITLEIEGKELTSPELATKIEATVKLCLPRENEIFLLELL